MPYDSDTRCIFDLLEIKFYRPIVKRRKLSELYDVRVLFYREFYVEYSIDKFINY